MKNLIKLVVLVGVIMVVVMVIKSQDEKVSGPESDPIDTVLEFYNPWLDAVASTSTDPYESGLHNSPLLSEELKQVLIGGANDESTDVDAVLCQSVVPERIGAKVIFVNETRAQIMVLPRGSDEPGMAIVTTVVKGNEWVIDSIECSMGDILPDREFSFEYEGQLLKDSLQSPLDSSVWHLVFVQNGELGHTAPLFFSELATCTDSTGVIVSCENELFTEATKVIVKGEMTESGVDVKFLNFVE